MYLHRYKQEFGFTIPGRPIIVDDIRVRGKGKAYSHKQNLLPLSKEPPQLLDVSTNCSSCVCMHKCVHRALLHERKEKERQIEKNSNKYIINKINT